MEKTCVRRLALPKDAVGEKEVVEILMHRPTRLEHLELRQRHFDVEINVGENRVCHAPAGRVGSSLGKGLGVACCGNPTSNQTIKRNEY